MPNLIDGCYTTFLGDSQHIPTISPGFCALFLFFWNIEQEGKNHNLIIITKELTNPTTIHVDCTPMHLALPLGLHFELQGIIVVDGFGFPT